ILIMSMRLRRELLFILRHDVIRTFTSRSLTFRALNATQHKRTDIRPLMIRI
mgnify:CR=1